MLSENMQVELQALAAQTCWCDDKEFMVFDYAGGNIDDAYYGGCNDGEILLARKLLAEMGRHNATCEIQS